MGKINNKGQYPIDTGLSLDDFLIGSDADTITSGGEKTKNYLLRGIFSTFKTSLNLASLEFAFAGGGNPELDEQDIGYFTTNSNNTLAGAITTININKADLNSVDITSLISTISGNLSSFMLVLYKPSAVGEIFYFQISAVVDNTTHYTLTVANFVGGNSLTDETTYTLKFDLAGVPSTLTETDPIFTASDAAAVTAAKIANWDTAFSWGNHAAAGYQDALTGGTGLLKLTGSIISYVADSSANWNTAFGWGDHSLAGYLTSESDPVFAASDAATVTSVLIGQWNAAYSWGDHSLVGYLTTETDPVFLASQAASITLSDVNNWDSAYSWGDHDGLYVSLTATESVAGNKTFTGSTVFQGAGQISIFEGQVNMEGQANIQNPTFFSDSGTTEGWRITNDATNNLYFQNDHVLLASYVTYYTLDEAGSPTIGTDLTTKTYVDTLAGDYVLVAGDTMTGELTAPSLRLTDTDDASLVSTLHAFQIGLTSGENLAMDGNEIMARNNGLASALYLNAEGGEVNIGNSSLANLVVSGDITAKGTGEPIKSWGTSTGIANVAYNSFYESNGSVRQGYIGFSSSGNSHFLMYSDVSSTYVFLDQSGGANGLKYNFSAASYTVWHSGNDGSGSGLDADLLDGLTTSVSGNRWGVVPIVSASGATEVGKYIDFHNTDSSASDNDGRLTLSSANVWDLNGYLTVDELSTDYITFANAASIPNANNFGTVIPEAHSIVVGSNSTGSTNYPAEFGQSMFVRGATTNRSFALWKANGSNSNHYIGNYTGSVWDWNKIVHEGSLDIVMDGGSSDNSFTIQSEGNANLYVKADTDNVTETHNPTIEMWQDGGAVKLINGIEGSANTAFSGTLDNSPYWDTLAAAGYVWAINGTEEMTLTSTELDLGSNHLIVNGFLLENSGDRPGLLEISHSTSYAWYGIQITDFDNAKHWSVMGDDTRFGNYDDELNEWIWLYTENAGMVIYYNGSAKLQTTNTGITVTGTGLATDWDTTSDRRLKTGDREIEPVGRINWLMYEKEGKTELGAIAQEVQKFAPYIVKEDDTENKMLSMSYRQLQILENMQLRKELDSANERIDRLEGLLSKLIPSLN